MTWLLTALLAFPLPPPPPQVPAFRCAYEVKRRKTWRTR